EILCGGVNHKQAAAAAIFRQGNLLHFGFEPSPAEMNDTGRALLINSIAYIARFTQDRPILRAGSPFAGQQTIPRSTLAKWLASDKYKLEWFENLIAPALLATIDHRDREGYTAWLERTRPYLRPGADTRITLDTDAESLKLRFDEIDFFEKAIPLLQ